MNILFQMKEILNNDKIVIFKDLYATIIQEIPKELIKQLSENAEDIKQNLLSGNEIVPKIIEKFEE